MLHYTVRALPEAHLYQVRIRVPASVLKLHVLTAASWTPGSYLMREFASRIRTPRAVAAATGETLKVVRLGKASWQVALEALEHLGAIGHHRGIHGCRAQRLGNQLGNHRVVVNNQYGGNLFHNPIVSSALPARAEHPKR